MTKRLICVFAALLVLCTPALAVYMGVLKNNVKATVSVGAASTNSGNTGVTICFLKSPGGSYPLCRTLTVAPGGIGQVVSTLPTGITRVIIEVDLPSGGNALLKVIQGANLFEQPITQDTRWVFDVAP
jgi:hypothetical protein